MKGTYNNLNKQNEYNKMINQAILTLERLRQTNRLKREGPAIAIAIGKGPYGSTEKERKEILIAQGRDCGQSCAIAALNRQGRRCGVQCAKEVLIAQGRR